MFGIQEYFFGVCSFCPLHFLRALHTLQHSSRDRAATCLQRREAVVVEEQENLFRDWQKF